MTRTDREAFLAGDRPDDVALYFADGYLDADALADAGERAGDGVVLVVPGERGRTVFSRTTGFGAMEFAQGATDREGHVDPALAGGICPETEGDGGAEADENGEDGENTDGEDGNDDTDGDSHRVQFVLAFAQEQNEEVGGRYAEGDVIHAYAGCSCGEAFSERWVAGER